MQRAPGCFIRSRGISGARSTVPQALEEKFSAHSAKVVNEEKKADTETGGDFEEHGSLADAEDLEKDLDEQGSRSLPDPLTFEMDLDIDAEEDSVLSIRPIEDKKD